MGTAHDSRGLRNAPSQAPNGHPRSGLIKGKLVSRLLLIQSSGTESSGCAKTRWTGS